MTALDSFTKTLSKSDNIDLCRTRTDADCSTSIIEESDPARKHKIYFGPFCLDSENARLVRDQEMISLTPKAFAVLECLLESAGQLIIRDTIFERVWPNIIVTDAALTVCVREIRNALGDNAKQPQYIETVQKRGYRFICPTFDHLNRNQGGNQADTAPNLDHTIVGRDRSLTELNHYLDVVKNGKRQLVFVTGEPGIGKTTLIDTFLQNNRLSSEVLIAKGRCIEQYGSGEAYLPVLDAFAGLARTADSEFAETIARHAPTWLSHLPVLRTELDGADSTTDLCDVNPQRMLREFTEALEAITEEKLMILVLEDLHWSDHATIDLLSFIARRDNPSHLLILATYRPADAEVQNHPVKILKQDLQPRGRCSSIPLEFLDQQHIACYLNAVFPNHDFPSQFSHLVHQHCDGNPLFMINLLTYLKNNDYLQEIDGQWLTAEKLTAQDRFIPDDIQLMVDQQIERLDPKCRELLEVASIASEPGGTAAHFTLTEVAAATGIDDLSAEPCLEGLARNGHFLKSIGIAEWPNGSITNCYEFTHAIYQNILYQRVSTLRKARTHQQLGLCLESAYACEISEIANKLAVHFEVGRDYHRAVVYLKESAERATQRGANREALLILDKARDLLAKLTLGDKRDQLELDLLLLIAPAITASQGNAKPEIETCYLQARSLCDKLGEQSKLFRVLFGLRSFYIIRGELKKAHRLAESLLGLATALNNSDLVIEARVGLASSEFFAGNHLASHQHAQKGAALYRKKNHAKHAALYGLDPGVFCLARTGQTFWPLGYPDQAVDYVQRSVDLAQTLDHPYSLVFAIHNRTLVHLYRRDGKAALRSGLRGKELALQHGFSFLSAWAYHLTAWAYSMTGNVQLANSEIESALNSERPDAPAADSYLALFLAESYFAVGDTDRALECLSIPCKEHSYDIERLYLHGELMLMQDDSKNSLNQIEAIWNRAIEESQQQQLKSYQLRVTVSLSKLLIKNNRKQEAYERLSEIVNWFQEGLSTADFQAAKQLLSGLEKTNFKAGKQQPKIVAYKSPAKLIATN